MGTKRFNIEDWNKKSPFKVPEGYMEGLTEKIMDQLPEHPSQDEEDTVASIADRIRPWLYLAASFVGLILLFKGLSLIKKQEHKAEPLYVQTNTPESSITAISEEDQVFLEYLEERYTEMLFLEEIENLYVE